MIKAQEVETSIMLFIHNDCKLESAKTHGRQLTILILLYFIFLPYFVMNMKSFSINMLVMRGFVFGLVNLGVILGALKFLEVFLSQLAQERS